VRWEVECHHVDKRAKSLGCDWFLYHFLLHLEVDPSELLDQTLLLFIHPLVATPKEKSRESFNVI